MNILEIKNNLIKLSYLQEENPVLGKFIVLAGTEKSYVAQFVNLKSDTANNYAIARLIFTFTTDGVVDNYDGSIPPVNSEVSNLADSELLDLLPVETPIQFGKLAHQDNFLNLDISVFERNFTVFAEKNSDRKTFISNCVKQLFKIKEKSVIIDDCNLFEDYPKIVLGHDFKLPLNSQMIDYIFEVDLKDVEASVRAVIQDIFHAVQQYIKTLDHEFLPIDKFIEVVTAQYKESQMPELALLKNKLLKYAEAGIFANTAEEIDAIKEKLNERNCTIVDLHNIEDSLQKETLSYLHDVINGFEKYVYLFVSLNDNNSDKMLLNKFINHNHIFTTMITGSNYKYASELYQSAENTVIFAPLIMRNDFAPYNTFLAKLNPDECVVYGKLTQGIPFITEMSDIDIGITIDDVLGDRFVFTPATEENTHISTYVETPQQSEFDFPPMDNDSHFQSINNMIEPVDNIFEDDNQEDLISEDSNEIAESNNLSDFEEKTEEAESEDFITEESDENLTSSDHQNEDEFIDLPPAVPVYPAEAQNEIETEIGFAQGDSVNHPRYGKGYVEKIIKYGNKTLCSIAFDNVGRRLLDPSISELTKL